MNQGPDLSPACSFFRELVFNNNRTWFKQNEQRYSADVSQPLAQLATGLAPLMLTIDPGFEVRAERGHVLSRPYRDMRFVRPGQGPLHEAAWLVFRNPALSERLPPAFFFEVSADGSATEWAFIVCRAGAWMRSAMRLIKTRRPSGVSWSTCLAGSMALPFAARCMFTLKACTLTSLYVHGTHANASMCR